MNLQAASPLASLMFSAFFVIALFNFSPLLASIVVVACGVAATVLFLHHHKRLPRFIMDILDRLSNKPRIEARFKTVARKMVTIDAEALAGKLRAKVVGQDAVISELCHQLRRRLAARRNNKPVAVICLAGPPGVGKTWLAKVLAKELYGETRALKFFDMSQFGQPHAAASLFGQARGYVGSTTYGALTGALRDHPECIILLDEIEKADPEVHKRFLTAWNDGFVTETSDGAQISTTDALFIMTTNAASMQIGALTKQYRDDAAERNRLIKKALLEANFAPEVLSRIDLVLPFEPLGGLDIARVVALEIESLVGQFDLEIVEKGIDPEILLQAIEKMEGRAAGGVRDISRAIEQDVSEGLIDARAQNAKTVSIGLCGGDIEVRVIDYADEVRSDAAQR